MGSSPIKLTKISLYKKMAQVDIAIYVSLVETSLILFFSFYCIFILSFIYPYFKNILFNNKFFIKILNDIFFIFISVTEFKYFNNIIKLKKY